MSTRIAVSMTLTPMLWVLACAGSTVPAWEADNPIRPLSGPPLGMEFYFAEAKTKPAPQRVRLGRWLFFDARLSSDHTISCASCHRPDHAFADSSPVSTGVGGKQGKRKAPTIINLAVTPRLMDERASEVTTHLFWDGRAASLEDQVSGPIENAVEMGSSHREMVAALARIPGYRPYFKEAFGDDEITAGRVAAAIADYERTRMSGNAPYDRWRFNHEPDAVSAQARRGFDLFFDTARCAQCHAGSNFTDNKFWNEGIGWRPELLRFSDEGRFLNTGDPRDHGAFKTPGLRDVARHPPYMHDGSLPTLESVVRFYDRGGNANPYRSRRLVPLGLTPEDIDAIVAFLRTLDGEGYQDTAPTHFPQ
jgi:cytochrome c peroxidase